MNNPLAHSELLGRRIRQDPPPQLGVSTQTLFEEAARAGEGALAAELLEYFHEEIGRIGAALFLWLEDILAFAAAEPGQPPLAAARTAPLLAGLRGFDPGVGDRASARAALAAGDAQSAIAAGERMRMREAAFHDTYVHWIQGLLTEVTKVRGEEAVFQVVERTYQRLWKERYAAWYRMTALERLQLSVEGMRGHLSGPGHRGDVGIVEEADRYVMVLDPCGSCGMLRRGNPESGCPGVDPAGNRIAHPWTWGRAGLSWYSIHSCIALEVLPARETGRVMRPMEDCDTGGPCRWFIYKDGHDPRPEHYARIGFAEPAAR